MNLLMLGGNSLRNLDWLQDVSNEFSNLFDESKIHKYRHWENPELETNFDFEIAALSKTVKDLSAYAIFAKSLGTLLAMKGITDAILKPSVILFCGFPLTVIDKENIPAADWLQNIKVPTIFLQNSEDPLGSHEAVNEFLASVNNSHLKLVLRSGDNHDYTDMDLIKTLMVELVN